MVTIKTEPGFSPGGFKEEAHTHMLASMVGTGFQEGGLTMVEIVDGLIHIGKIDKLADIEDKSFKSVEHFIEVW
jgi:hypothetical protein